MRKLTYALALFLTLAGLLLLLETPAPAQASTECLGIWRATLDGVPSVTLTLANDTGSLDGSVVFYSVNGKTHRAMSIEPYTLLHPRLDAHTLTFQVRRPDARLLTFHVDFATPGKATIRCLDCTPDAPSAKLSKDTL